jgi:hypothetical protein
MTCSSGIPPIWIGTQAMILSSLQIQISLNSLDAFTARWASKPYSPMNLESLLIIILRLVAVKIFLTSALQLVAAFLVNSRVPHSADIPVILLIAAFFLLGWARSIARFFLSGMPRELPCEPLRLSDWYSVILFAVAAFHITVYLPLLLTWSHYLLIQASNSGAWKQTVNWYEPAYFMYCLMGVFLLAKGRLWAGRFAASEASFQQQRAQTANPPSLPEEPQ